MKIIMLRMEAGTIISRCATLAGLLEVSGYPKPGNVHRTQDFAETRYEHFLAAAVATAPSYNLLAIKGFDALEGLIDWRDIEIGKIILHATMESLKWQTGGNVNLGIILLFAPLAAAGGASLCNNDYVDPNKLRKHLSLVINATSSIDSVNVYKAIASATSPRVLGESMEIDVFDDSSKRKILDEGLNLLDIFRKCAARDSICSEWVSDFNIVFKIGYPHLKKFLRIYDDINKATVNTFLKILSEQPDSLISRKIGVGVAKQVSARAKDILEVGGASSIQGLKMLNEFDIELQKEQGVKNPGTTADLTAASLFILLMEGWRP
jgi:triphosphoribosyl-dephospho-CoA synthase